ncbi:MAG: hypothetical protein ACREFC_14255, partial [Stellaceae bacterium]
ARAVAEDLPSLEQESSHLAVETEQLGAKLQQSVTAKHANEPEFDRLDTAGAPIRALASQIEAQRPKVESLCHRTVPKEQLAAATAQCNAVLVPFNHDVDTYKTDRAKWNQAHQKVVDQEKARVAAAQLLIQRRQAIEKRLAAVKEAIARLLRNAKLQCMQDCTKSGSTDAAGYCLQRCWDNAVAGLSPVERNKQYQAQFGTRTVEQAIEEYKRSGAADPGHKTLKIKEPPPPPK